VPQQAVSHDAGGKALVHVVDAQERLHDRNVDVGDVVEGVILSFRACARARRSWWWAWTAFSPASP
jgi:hypothetical protein